MKLFGIDVGYGNSLKDKLYWLITGFMTRMGFIVWGGSPPPPAAPTQTTVMNTNIPDYAQPYVENMLNAAQAQIYNPSGTGFNPYTPYSNDPRNYVAGFSPLQQQAQSAAANLRTPGAYNAAMGQTMGATRNLGMLGNQMGLAGMNYANQATSPAAINAYMNPYLQASLAPQLALANQQYGIAGQQEGSTAAQQGAFGGTREALMNSLNKQNQMLAQNQLIGQGYNQAFNAAQQAQQFGANLGLSGQQAQAQALASQLSGANQLAGIGGQQLAAQQNILGTQAQQGALEQQNQQNIINQAVQNYATAQQYPFMQLGVLNSMLRGLPMQQSSTQMYQAPPSTASQLAGIGTAGIGLAGMANAAGMFGSGKADGGVIKAKEGGVMKAAGGIPISMYSTPQLQKVQQSPYSTPLAKIVASGYIQDDQRLKANPEAPKVLAQIDGQPITAQPINRTGVGSIATPPDLTTLRAAGGGLLAFAGKDESLVPDTGDDARNFKLASDAIDLNTPKALKTNLKQEDNNPSNSSSTPFTLFGHPMNKAARDVEMVKGTGLNWQDQIRPQAKPNDSFDEFMKTQDTRPSYAAPVVTAKTIEAGLKAQKSAPVIKEVAKEAAPAETAKSDYDEIKQMLINEYKNPSTKTADEIKAQLAAVNKRMADREASAGYEALARAGFGIMAGTSPHALVNIGQGAPEGLESYQKSKALTAEDQNLIDKYTIAGKSADEARHQQVGLNLLKVGEQELAAKNALESKILALQQAKQLHDESQATKNLLAASLIQQRNYKEDTVKGEKSSQIGGAISTFDNALKQIDKVQNHPGRYNGADVIGAAESHVPNTDAYDYKTALQGLKDTQFMASIAGIKGTGIGRILLPEVAKIQNSTGVLDTHQSKAQFDANLNNLRNLILAAKSRAIGSANQYGITPQDLGIVQ